MENMTVSKGANVSDSVNAILKSGEKKLAEQAEVIRKDASEFVVSVVDKVTPLAKEQFAAIKNRTNKIVHGAEDSIRSHPFWALGIAAAVGGILGLTVLLATRTRVRA